MSNIAYKAVLRTSEPDVFRSCIVTGKNSLKYEIGKSTIPKAGGVLCFKDLERASSFCMCNALGAVLAVDYEEIIPLPIVRLGWKVGDGWDITIDAIRRTWKGGLVGRQSYGFVTIGQQKYRICGYWPVGTIAVASVTPLHVAYERESE